MGAHAECWTPPFLVAKRGASRVLKRAHGDGDDDDDEGDDDDDGCGLGRRPDLSSLSFIVRTLALAFTQETSRRDCCSRRRCRRRCRRCRRRCCISCLSLTLLLLLVARLFSTKLVYVQRRARALVRVEATTLALGESSALSSILVASRHQRARARCFHVTLRRFVGERAAAAVAANKHGATRAAAAVAADERRLQKKKVSDGRLERGDSRRLSQKYVQLDGGGLRAPT